MSRVEHRLPETLEYDPNLLLIAFKQHQQRDVDTWLPVAAQLREQFPRFGAYELPVISRAYRPVAGFIDAILQRAWKKFLPPDTEACLVAVGGYGRGELHPHSDIDILLLVDEGNAPGEDTLSGFVTQLWDIGLQIGHSVRTVAECESKALEDITILTNLMEARTLRGDAALLAQVTERIATDRMWPSGDFFRAKLVEQKDRHAKYADTEYSLEPNVKSSPGGLRDLQNISWIAERHFGVESLERLTTEQFLQPKEMDILQEGRDFMWRVRYALHMITDREEDRLLFDHQRTLAQLLGYQDRDHRLAVEWFMKDYYRAIQELSRLNEMLLQLLRELILHRDDPGQATPINRRFQARKGFLEVTHERVFKRYPFALLELFLLMQQHGELKGVRASTIRLVRDHRYLIDDKFRHDIRARSLFMEIFRQPRGPTHELRRMNRYGVLAAYFPAFANIVGQMQHDMFHAYTVDEHTLFVVRNLRRFFVAKFMHEFPLCSRVAHSIPKPELLYLAGFFHDIGKGRGGNHSELGAADARAFLGLHGLSEYDRELVAWLVENHLLMSQTAQRRDISDPEVINDFARHIGDRRRLD